MPRAPAKPRTAPADDALAARRAMPPDLRKVLVAELAVAPENPRVIEGEAGVDELAESLVASGVLMPLIGYIGAADDEKRSLRFFITAGGRRVRALHRLVAAGRWPEDWCVPVDVRPREAAVAAGVTEQLSHAALSGADAVRALTTPFFAGLPDREAARQLGLSLADVRRKRRVLDLPAEALDRLWAGTITADQAVGLTYAIEQPGLMDQFLERIEREGPGFTAEGMKRWFSSTCMPWRENRWAAHIDQEAYKAAGGRLQADLFSGDHFILDPQVAERLAREAILARLKVEHPGYGAYVEDDGAWGAERHPGIDPLTAEERAEIAALERRPEAELPEADLARRAALRAKGKGDRFPPELRARLACHYRIHGYAHGRSRGYDAVTDVIPKGAHKALAAEGLLAPARVPAEKAGEGLPKSLREAVARVLTHVARLILIQDPDVALADFAVHLASATAGGPSSFRYEWSPRVDREMLAPFAFIPPPAWEEAERWRGTFKEPADLAALRRAPPATQRLVLAWSALLRLAEPAQRHLPQVPVDVLYAYWRPDAAWWRRYKAPQLRDMISAHQTATGVSIGAWSDLKKDGLVELLVVLVTNGARILPLGFPEAPDGLALNPSLPSRAAMRDEEPDEEGEEDFGEDEDAGLTEEGIAA